MFERKTIDEIVKFVTYKLKEHNIESNEFIIQKLIFKIKMELGEDHELYEKLPYYWYNYGPVSDPITESINHLSDENILINGNMNTEYYNNFDEININQKLSDLNTIINNIFKNIEMNEIGKDIYRNYAPYEFMYPYRYEIFEFAKNSEKITEKEVETLELSFVLCEANLPNDEYFLEYSKLYSKISSIISLLEDQGYFIQNWTLIRELILSLWFVFAKGIRVKFNDKYYANKIESWKLEFEHNIDLLESSSEKLEDIVKKSDIKFRGPEFNENEKKILYEMFKEYLE